MADYGGNTSAQHGSPTPKVQELLKVMTTSVTLLTHFLICEIFVYQCTLCMQEFLQCRLCMQEFLPQCLPEKREEGQSASTKE